MMRLAGALLLLSVGCFADHRLEAYPACQKHKQVCDEVIKAIDSGELFAPMVSSSGVLAEDGDAPIQPVVLMHGLGDAGSNPGMQSLAKSIMDAYPGSYAVAVDVANSLKSFFSLIPTQVEEFAATVKADPKLANGFQAIGLSQGGIIVRAYIQQYNDPPVSKFISICGVVNGVFACPLEVDFLPFVCKDFAKDPYNFLDGDLHLSFSSYFTTFWNKTEFMHGNKLMPLLNNILPTGRNATYAKNIESLDLMLLIEATKDTVVYPFQAEQFGGWKWTDNDPDTRDLYSMADAEFYDLFGLKTLNEAGKVKTNSFVGNHLQFSNTFWQQSVLPFLKH